MENNENEFTNMKGWEFLLHFAEKEPNTIKRNELIEEAYDMKREDERRLNELVFKSLLAKFLNFISLVILAIVIYIVIILWKKSIFEGFVSAIVGFFFIKYIIQSRNNDIFS